MDNIVFLWFFWNLLILVLSILILVGIWSLFVNNKSKIILFLRYVFSVWIDLSFLWFVTSLLLFTNPVQNTYILFICLALFYFLVFYKKWVWYNLIFWKDNIIVGSFENIKDKPVKNYFFVLYIILVLFLWIGELVPTWDIPISSFLYTNDNWDYIIDNEYGSSAYIDSNNDWNYDKFVVDITNDFMVDIVYEYSSVDWDIILSEVKGYDIQKLVIITFTILFLFYFYRKWKIRLFNLTTISLIFISYFAYYIINNSFPAFAHNLEWELEYNDEWFVIMSDMDRHAAEYLIDPEFECYMFGAWCNEEDQRSLIEEVEAWYLMLLEEKNQMNNDDNNWENVSWWWKEYGDYDPSNYLDLDDEDETTSNDKIDNDSELENKNKDLDKEESDIDNKVDDSHDQNDLKNIDNNTNDNTNTKTDLQDNTKNTTNSNNNDKEDKNDLIDDINDAVDKWLKDVDWIIKDIDSWVWKIEDLVNKKELLKKHLWEWNDLLKKIDSLKSNFEDYKKFKKEITDFTQKVNELNEDIKTKKKNLEKEYSNVKEFNDDPEQFINKKLNEYAEKRRKQILNDLNSKYSEEINTLYKLKEFSDNPKNYLRTNYLNKDYVKDKLYENEKTRKLVKIIDIYEKFKDINRKIKNYETEWMSEVQAKTSAYLNWLIKWFIENNPVDKWIDSIQQAINWAGAVLNKISPKVWKFIQDSSDKLKNLKPVKLLKIDEAVESISKWAWKVVWKVVDAISWEDNRTDSEKLEWAKRSLWIKKADLEWCLENEYNCEEDIEALKRDIKYLEEKISDLEGVVNSN